MKIDFDIRICHIFFLVCFYIPEGVVVKNPNFYRCFIFTVEIKLSSVRKNLITVRRYNTNKNWLVLICYSSIYDGSISSNISVLLAYDTFYSLKIACF